MKDYFLEIVKDGVRIDVAHTKANTQEEANAVITKAAIGRGMENFSVREVTQEEFDAFRAKQKPDDDKQAEADRLAANKTARIRINGGEWVDANSSEGKELMAKATAQLADAAQAGEPVFVSVNDGPEYLLDSPEATAEIEALSDGTEKAAAA